MRVLNRNNKRITLLGEKIIIHERDSYDIMMMVQFNQKNKMQVTPELFLYQCAKVVETGSKYSHKYFPWFRPIKKLKLWYKLRVKYLLKHLSQTELVQVCNEIYVLEGLDLEELKKKVNPEIH